MIISPRHKLVILLPWKTASQTLRARLRRINRSPYSDYFHFNPHLNRVVHQHATLADFLGMPESSRGYAVAVFVRNPYDRVYSGFKQLMRDVVAQPKMKFPSPWIKELVMEQVSSHSAMLHAAKFDIDAWFLQLPIYQLLDAGRDTSLPLHPAYYWTHANGRQVADFIGRVENFESDFDRLVRSFGIEKAGDQNENLSEDGDVDADRHGYRYRQRLGPKTIAKINDVFRQDFELFGYEKITKRR